MLSVKKGGIQYQPGIEPQSPGKHSTHLANGIYIYIYIYILLVGKKNPDGTICKFYKLIFGEKNSEKKKRHMCYLKIIKQHICLVKSKSKKIKIIS